MLVVHPASTCDVCLESYNSRPQNIPYSISCGHVFCLSCLKSLRQHICPLCRSPFEASDLRRLHIDRADAQLLDAPRTPSPSRAGEEHPELPFDNALGLIDDGLRPTQLGRKISDLVLRSAFTNGVRERGVRELIQEIHVFLSTEPRDMHTDLRASFLLLYRFTDLQTKYQQLEFDLRTENSRSKQAAAESERRYQDLQRSRIRDQESAKKVEESLRERLHIEELEWQRKYDFVSEECANLRDELDKLRFSSPNRPRVPHRSSSSTQLLYAMQSVSHTVEKSGGYTMQKDDTDVFSNLDPGLFHLSPVPPAIALCDSRQSSDSDDDAIIEKHRRRAPDSPSRTSSTSSNISRASDSAAALKLYSGVVPTRLVANRQRSDSYPTRGSDKAKAYRFDSQPEVSTSAPSSYMYRPASPNRALFPTTPPTREASIEQDASQQDSASVARLYSLLEKPVPPPEPRNALPEQHSARPPLPRSTSYQQTRSSDYNDSFFTSASSSSAQNTPSLRRAQQRIQVQTSLLPASQFQKSAAPSPQTPTQNQSVAQAADAISPIQRTPPRPVLPHMHSYFYSPPPAKPVSPKENHVGVRGTLPRRGSLSSASAAALAASSAQPPAVVPPSSLGLRRSRGQGLFGGQDSDA